MTSSLSSLLQTLRIVPMAHTKLPAASAEKLAVTTTVMGNNNSSVATTLDAKILPELTLSDVSQHDSYDDCWIVIYDRVYDVTDFLRDHPGGDHVIMDHAGRDATLAFHGTGHSRDAIAQMRDYLIGELPVEERIFRTSSTGARLIRLDVPE